jgi:ISXO2-like transposase domain
VKLRRVRRFTKNNIKKIPGRIVTRGARFVTDGLGCFNSVADAGCTHEPIATVSGRKAARHSAFKAINTVLGNIKSAIAATFRSASRKHAPLAR